MARVPHRVRPDVPLSRQGQTYLDVPRNPGAFGVGVGAAIAGMGAALAPLGQALQQRQEQTDRFGALRDFSSFMTEAQTALEEAKRGTDPGTANFPAIADATFRNVESKFLSRLPPDLQQEFSARTGQVKNRLMLDALNFQYQQQDQFFHAGISDAYEEAKLAVSRTPDEYEQWLAHVFETIDTAAIPDTEKFTLQRKIQAGLAGVLYLREAQELESGFLPSDGTEIGIASAILRDEEGFAPTAGWDVTAFRGGYGSDTKTLEDGTVVPVEQGMQFTEAEAEADLKRRTPEFRNTIVKQVGLDTWARLPTNVRGALITVAYQHGSLPPSVVGAIRNLDAMPQLPKVEGGVSQYYSDADLRDDRFKGETGPEALYLLDRVTEGMGRKLQITSAFRSKEYNKTIPGAAANSQHTHGNAIDISTAGMSEGEKAKLVALAAANGATGFGYYNNWIHIDTRPAEQVVKWPKTGRPDWFDAAILAGGTEMQGNFEGVAQAVENLPTTPKRQKRVADVIRGRGLGNMGQDDLDADPRFSSIPYETRLALREDARRTAAQEQTAAARAAKEAKDQALNSLLIGFNDGTKGFADYEQAKLDGTLDDFDDRRKAQNELERVYGDLMKLRAAQAKDDNPRSIWSPGLKEDRDQQNLLLDKNRLLAADPKYITDSLVPAVERRGDIPTDAVAILEGMFSTGNRENMLFALDALGQMQDVGEDAFNRRVSPELAGKVDYWRAFKDYYNEEEILEKLRGPKTQQERQAREVLAKEATDLIATDEANPTEAIISHFSGFFSGTPEAGGVHNAAHALPMLKQEADTIFVDEFSKSGDADKAMEITVKRMARAWGVSTVGGGNILMKYPMEKVYPEWPPKSGDRSWIDPEIRRRQGLRSSQQFRVFSDDQTKMEVQEYARGELPYLPSYGLMVKDENGVWSSPLREEEAGTGRRADDPGRFTLEFPEHLRVQEEIAFDDRVKDAEYRNFNQTYEQAKLHALTTGTPIPEELVEEREMWREYFNQRRGRPQLEAPSVLEKERDEATREKVERQRQGRVPTLAEDFLRRTE